MPLRLIALILSVTLICATGFAAPIPLQASLLFPDIPNAAVTGTEGIILNPAALFINKPFGFQVYHSFPKDDFSGDHAALISAGGLGFGYQSLSLGFTNRISRYDLAASSKVIRNIYTGLSYTYYKTDFKPLDKVHSWNISLLAHITRLASVSGQAENLNRQVTAGVKSAIGYIFSAALRPAGEIVTLGGNLKMYAGQTLDDAYWRAMARISLKQGIALFGAYDEKKTFGVGLEFHFGTAQLGGEGFLDNDGKYYQSTIYASYSIAPREDLITGPGRILQVDISGDIPEEKTSRFLFMRSDETVLRKISKIKAAQFDPQIKGILLTINDPAIGWGKLTEFRRAISDFRKTGKRVIAYMGVSPGNGSYYLASAANEVYMLPVDALNLMGLRAEITFYKGTLDKLGVEAEVEKIGEYKNYPDLFTDSTLTPPHRESVESLLDDLYQTITNDIAKSRNLSREDVERTIDKGPFTSTQAESLGLVDGRMYPLELEERLPELFGGRWPAITTDLYKSTPRYRERFGEAPQIAVIAVAGSITVGHSGSSLIEGKTAGSATISDAIRRAKDSRAVKAIVLRLDTPGGDARASDLIWSELIKARERKPVIVSMSDVCASGGYYVASASDKILLDPTTITGSIGVFWGKANLEGLYHKLGMRTETITRGKHANMYSSKSGFSAEERGIVKRQVRDLYDNFVSIVAENRHLGKDSIDAIARGRVWSGKSALSNGLADQEGGLLQAIDEAKAEAGIKDNDYLVIEMPERKLGLSDIPQSFVSSVAMLLGFGESSRLSSLGLRLLSADNSPQLIMPYTITVQ